MVSKTPSVPARLTKSAKSVTSLSSKFSKRSKPDRTVRQKSASDFRQFISETRSSDGSIKDGGSMKEGASESMVPPSEPASSRMSMGMGTDFLTHRFLTDRFLTDLPSSKLSWHLESPGPKSEWDWEGTDFEVRTHLYT